MQEDSTFNKLKSQVKDFPKTPGVYLMKDKKGIVIYVGKAKVLRNRVSSYFTGQKDIKTSVLLRKIDFLEFITTQSEYEALLLENNLIKKYNPRFNINLKDGKSYPVIRITNDKFPRVYRTRRIIQDGSEYFGPFPNVKTIDIYLELIEKLFPLRKCKGKLKYRDSPCLYYHIGRCKAPCVKKITEAGYEEDVEKVRQLLSGRTEELTRKIKIEMLRASEELNFESAAKLRDTLIAIEQIGSEQKIIDFDEEKRDYIALVHEGELATFVVFQMRNGKLIGRDLFRTKIYGTEEDAMTDFILLYYQNTTIPPQQIFVSVSLDFIILKDLFSSEWGHRTEFHLPERGRHQKFMKMAMENARLDIDRQMRDKEIDPGLEELKRVLNLSHLPKRIEGFDIAQLHGKDPVASMVSFWMGKPDNKAYRQFHMKSLGGQIDDFKSIREAVARRYSRVINDDLPKPDLILIDGGKGQVSSAMGVLRALGLGDIPLLGLAKREEEIFLPDKSEPIIIPIGSPALRILIAVRDEAHRFATTFNKKLRQKRIKIATLEGIEGIGPKRSQRILKAFGGLDGIKSASYEEISEKARIPMELAETVKTFVTKKVEIDKSKN
ncbi:excinuclease ABC subunit UvrC [Spirochaeta cellobiosiphila]|uniref:excinuclease ABC subunit UvrC n=1 Tax=Spirochaeta cellobiosiphila TaxID=504483 RepID=UPI0004111E7F|nr:excinuclease ABC subunit UvrC [Spirochaeta cellobiosiphila]